MATLPNYAELTPSYGRDYMSAAKAKEGFRSGEDWTLAETGQQTSIRDLEVGTTVLLRYKRLTGVTTITAKPNGSYS